MPIKIRPDPIIPDHEVLRKIGGGAYGEVWLARGVTGALRAVKIVWREDFEDARGFEREFEGILKFEPISRDHPGLVNILHVGRSVDGVSFYYYVMELGDDILSGADINPVEYEPRTLRADSKSSGGVRMELNACVDVGLRLAEALGHLHERGLAHRDVKPANVIFVNGRAKLADIGLVATRDQRTFVGTEGFVPPEGPGSAQADVYSLGKVLYEIVTGKDRLDFPELPDEPPKPEERKRWLELNRIICDTCDPHLSRRKIRTAAALADALRQLQPGKRRRSLGMGAWITSLVLGVFAIVGLWDSIRTSPLMSWIDTINITEPPPEPEAPNPIGRIRIVSYPEGADVIGPGGQLLGVTPLDLRAPVGSDVEYRLVNARYKEKIVKAKVPRSTANEILILGGEMENFTPPEVGQVWENLGASYLPVEAGHLGSEFVSEASWIAFTQNIGLTQTSAKFLSASQNGSPGKIALVTPAEAETYCSWLREDAIQGGRLTENHEMIPTFEDNFTDPSDPATSTAAKAAGLRPFHVLVRLIQYGEIVLKTDPPGALIMVNDKIVSGSASGPVMLRDIKPGIVKLSISLDGYAPQTWEENLKPGEVLEIERAFVENKGVRFDRAWKNGLGMQFVPLGDSRELMVSAWETRVSDFATYKASAAYQEDIKKPGARAVPLPGFKQGDDHPVVCVNRENATNFCIWLTEQERADQRISVSHEYRLPTDLEWSMLVGINEPPKRSADWREANSPKAYAWGTQWPPPDGIANLADVRAAATRGMQPDRVIPNYKDGFPKTAPVGSFPPTIITSAGKPYEIFDVCGNASEWVSDNRRAPSPGHTTYGMLRGGSWTSFQPNTLYTGYRYTVPPAYSDEIYGFRVVLAKVPLTSEDPADP